MPYLWHSDVKADIHPCQAVAEPRADSSPVSYLFAQLRALKAEQKQQTVDFFRLFLQLESKLQGCITLNICRLIQQLIIFPAWLYSFNLETKSNHCFHTRKLQDPTKYIQCKTISYSHSKAWKETFSYSSLFFKVFPFLFNRETKIFFLFNLKHLQTEGKLKVSINLDVLDQYLVDRVILNSTSNHLRQKSLQKQNQANN